MGGISVLNFSETNWKTLHLIASSFMLGNHTGFHRVNHKCTFGLDLNQRQFVCRQIHFHKNIAALQVKLQGKAGRAAAR
jgi:hypothetical protein